MPNDENECIDQVVRSIHSKISCIQSDKRFMSKKNWTNFQLLDIQLLEILCGIQLLEKLSSGWTPKFKFL